jgi:hypothetical protein
MQPCILPEPGYNAAGGGGEKYPVKLPDAQPSPGALQTGYYTRPLFGSTQALSVG